MPTRLINVSNRLPVTVSADGIKKSSGGLVAALEGLPAEEFELLWLGWPGTEVPEADHPEVRRKLEQEQGCSPVFLPKALADAHYEGLSNSSIWPLLHYMPSRFRYDPVWWAAYEQVNRLFADHVLSLAKDGDLVWVHDYQLMLLPRLLKDANPSLRVGFFLHTPFPSYEVFRCHPNREALAAGLLGADLVGFHTFNYLRHYRSAAQRLLGADAEVTTIRHGGRSTALGVYPIGINAPKFEQELGSDALQAEFAKLKQAHAGKQVVLSVERLDYTKGIIQRLDAIELYLERNGGSGSGRAGQVKFVFIAVPSREGVEEYQVLREEIERRVGHMNGRFATLSDSPVRFIYGSVTFTELCALYALADVAIVTPLMDGMNLVAKEYVACQPEQDLPGDEGPGALVLSEFAGAAEELFDALLVNPYDAAAVAGAIERALAMPVDERRARMAGMRRRVMSFDARAWAQSFVADLAARPATISDAAVDGGAAAAGERLRAAVAAGRRVALFLDYDGTLRDLVADPAAAAPTADLRALLDRLHALPNVDTTIISGRVPEELATFVGDHDRFRLVAEHGAAVRPPGKDEWERADDARATGWKEPILRLLRLFEASTPGTVVEEKRTGFVWHHRRADPEFGEWKAKALVAELSAVAGNDPVTVRRGRKIVEVTSAHVNKGVAVERALAGRDYDLVFIAGDDTTDESMFRLGLPPDKVVTVRVGDGESAARYRVAGPAELRELLQRAAAAAVIAVAPVG
jgi:trehalose 6-phosphate synthase/phosphatase